MNDGITLDPSNTNFKMNTNFLKDNVGNQEKILWTAMFHFQKEESLSKLPTLGWGKISWSDKKIEISNDSSSSLKYDRFESPELAFNSKFSNSDSGILISMTYGPVIRDCIATFLASMEGMNYMRGIVYDLEVEHMNMRRFWADSRNDQGLQRGQWCLSIRQGSNPSISDPSITPNSSIISFRDAGSTVLWGKDEFRLKKLEKDEFKLNELEYCDGQNNRLIIIKENPGITGKFGMVKLYQNSVIPLEYDITMNPSPIIQNSMNPKRSQQSAETSGLCLKSDEVADPDAYSIAMKKLQRLPPEKHHILTFDHLVGLGFNPVDAQLLMEQKEVILE